MAGDWIKMRTTLATSPKVAILCRLTRLDTYAVCGRLYALWSWADQHTDDGTAPGVTAEYIDSTIVGRKGFAEALTHEHVGWLEITDDGIVFPDYHEHNGSTAKRRAKDAQRKGMSRTRADKKRTPFRTASACDADTMRNREEKRREEKRRGGEDPPDPPATDPRPPNFLAWWQAYPAHRRVRMDRCLAAWRVAVSELEIDPDLLVAKAREYAASDVGKGQFCLAAWRWLEDRCWADDPAAWRESDKKREDNYVAR